MSGHRKRILCEDGREKRIQTPACDRCSVGVMDATNPHLWGECGCDCHGENHRYGPGNPDWEHDFERELGGAYDGFTVISDADSGL